MSEYKEYVDGNYTYRFKKKTSFSQWGYNINVRYSANLKSDGSEAWYAAAENVHADWQPSELYEPSARCTAAWISTFSHALTISARIICVTEQQTTFLQDPVVYKATGTISGKYDVNGTKTNAIDCYDDTGFIYTVSDLNKVLSIPLWDGWMSNGEDSTTYNFVIQGDVDIPVFDSYEHLEAYVLTGSLEGCINYDDEFSEETQDYYIYQRWSAASAKNGEVTRTGESTGFFERILANGPICLKKTSEPNAYTILGAGIVGSAFSSINQYTVEQIEKKNFTDGLMQAGPVYDRYRNSYGDGTFIVGFGDLNSIAITNIPMFSDPEKADDYIAGNVPIEDADNYSYISGGVGVEGNPTGEPEDVTTLSRNLSRGVFAADYTMSRSGLVSLASDFFSSNFWDDIKDGLKYYNNNYMSAVSSCIYFPFDISSIFDLVAVNYVGFGSYQHDVSNYGISRVAFNKGVKDLGETFIRPTFNNFLDFAAVEIYLFLPYIGFVQLQTDKYMGKTLKIQYSIDIHSGECSALLFANGTLMDTYDGQIGIVNPITAEDLAGYAQAQISGIKSALGSVAGGGISGAMAGAKGGAYGAAAGAIVGSGLGAVNAGLTAYGLMNMKPQLFSSGGYSGALGANLPQYAFLVFAIHETEEPANLIQTHGKPSNRSGLIGDFSGFLSVNSVNLNCGDATEAERAEILQLLYSGIII